MMDTVVTLRVTVTKDPDNVARAWGLPGARVVAKELADVLVDLDLDTGWIVKDVSP